jgi:FAD/FMN-containing dehydrogenase
MVATNAAGASSLTFGATRQWVRSLDCIFADGSRARISRDTEPSGEGPVLARWRAASESLRARCRVLEPRQVRKDASGYGVHDFAASGHLVDLLAGSEGTLAFVVDAELDLCPLPAATASLLSAWPSLEQAVHGAALAREGDAVACELLDGTFLRVASGRSLLAAAGAECAAG